jgi:hypothetical protein
MEPLLWLIFCQYSQGLELFSGGGLDRGVMMLEIEKIVALRETKQGGLTRVV